jgi:cell division protein FtsN
LGAYKNRLSKNVFKDINDLIEIKTDDGLYKYMTGSFTTFDAAAKHKVDLLLKGYQGAFITAYKDGKRVTLMEAGATPQKKEDIVEQTTSDNSAVSAVNKKLVTFKIQVGVFKNEPPPEKAAKFQSVKGISKEITPTGLNRFTVGPFSDYAAAQSAKNELVKNGIDDAFILAFFNGEYITIQEALELLK